LAVSSIRLHQLLLVAAVLVPALLLAAAAWWNREEVLSAGEETVVRTSAIMEEHAHKVFDTVDLVLGRIDERIQDKTWDEISAPETSEFLRRLDEPLEHTVSIWIADGQGKVRAGSQEWDRNISIAERDFFRVHRGGNGGTYISAAFVGKATHTASFAVSRRRTTPDGLFDGTIHVSLGPEYFEQFYAEAAPPGPHAALLVRADGEILARDPARENIERFSPNSPLMRHIAHSPGHGFGVERSSLDGEERLFAYGRVSEYPAYVVFGIPTNAILARWHRNLRGYGIVSGAAALTLLLVSWLALRRARAEQDALARLRRESEQRLQAEQRMLHMQKMEGIGQLTGGIAHDFNNLLAVILGNLTLLKNRLPADERMQRLLDGALQGAERGGALTQRLLAFARRQELSPRSVDLAALVTDMSSLIRRSAGPEVGIVMDFPGRLPAVRVDPHQLELALLNLAVNARDAMPSGGTITISAREARLAEGEMSGLEAGSYVCIAVADTGTGMDEATLMQATEPFFTTKGVGKGTGLGLSMVDGLAAQSGGAFRIKSRLGLGTTAEIWLPCSDQAPEPAPAEQPASRPAMPQGSCKILVVDDDVLVAAGTVAMLEELGHDAIEAPSGEKALELLAADRSIDLVITDQSMPRMTGTQLARRIRERWPDMPILLATGHAEVPDRGALDLPRLGKPYRMQDLADAISATLERCGSRGTVTQSAPP
jgi:signal transduction histidine kinase/CheY-like chemotaxis protein